MVETQKSVQSGPDVSLRQLRSAMADYGLSDSTLDAVAIELGQSPGAMEKFLLRFYHEQTESAGSTHRAYVTGATIALGYFVGGLIPLLPYLFSSDMNLAFWWSCGAMVNVLFIFGFVKTWLIDNKSNATCLWGGIQMVVLGSLAAAASVGCVTVIGRG